MARIVTDDDGIVWRESFDDWLGYTQFTVVIIMCGWCVGGGWTVQRSLSFKYISSGRNGRSGEYATGRECVKERGDYGSSSSRSSEEGIGI